MRKVKWSAWMVTGREKEALAFYPPLDEGDMDTLVSILGFLEGGAFPMPVYILVWRRNKELRFLQIKIGTTCSRTTKDLPDKQELPKEKKPLGGFYYWISFAKETADELKKNGFGEGKTSTNATVNFCWFCEFSRILSQISFKRNGCRIGIIVFRQFWTWSPPNMVWEKINIGDCILSACGVTGKLP